ncbi:MAG: HWE histidine kinase domain-containing protein [Hyphomicrobiales bacterium]
MVKASTGPGHQAGANFLTADSERLVRIVEAGGAGLWQWNLGGGIVHLSSNLAALLGLEPAPPILPVGAFYALVHQDDIDLFRMCLTEAVREERPFVHEFRVARQNDGEERWLSFRGQALNGEDTDAQTLSGLCLDVTDRRLVNEAYDLLNRELSHRIKNLFSVVHSLVTMTGEHRPEAGLFVSSFQARLNAFAAAHELLMQAEWQAVRLKKLVAQVLSTIGVTERVDLSGGCEVMLGSHDAQTIALLLHELATNAIKHGALSNGEGRVALSFEVEEANESGSPVVMIWEERGGPEIKPPDTRGFGLKLIEHLTKRQSSGRPVIKWRPDGLHCCVELRIAPVESAAR